MADQSRYLVAKLFKPLIGCEIASLRALNVGALCLICPLCYGILRVLRMQAFRTRSDADRSGANKRALTEADASVAIDAHSALSIALFPPLFFFSALFYTDVMSTLAVLLSYSVYLKKSTAAGSIFDNVIAVLIGIIALLFRQTNIFWVAVFPAGLTVIETLQAVAGPSTTLRPTTFVGVMNRSWTEGYIHDRTVDSANFGGLFSSHILCLSLMVTDYVFLFVSLPIAALRNLVLVARAAIPYVVLLSLFAGFVIWNGSVVLGKIHLPKFVYRD